MRSVLLGLLATASCAGHLPIPGPTRFAERPPVWRVADRADISRPAKRTYYKGTHAFDNQAVYEVTRALSVPRANRAGDTNALDQVPDSTWFTNRIGRHPLSPEQIRRGPDSGHDPMDYKPWTVVSTKVGGAETGFFIRDRAGVRYVLKFDTPGFPENETGAHLIVQRILWAAGYNVPDDRLVHFSPGELVVDRDSEVADEFGNRRRLSQREVDARLAGVDREKGRPIRALASRFVDGIPVGGFPDHGTRADDPNDRVPHEQLRELRGLQPLAAWLRHADIKEGNTIDAWTADPGRPGVHYLVHYFIDFGKALGNSTLLDRDPKSSYGYGFDWGKSAADLFSLGMRRRQWDCLVLPRLRGVGAFDSEHYDPGRYRPAIPFRPFEDMDRSDGFWGAELIMRFTEADLRAAVDTAQFSDPAAADYVLRTLVARQRKTARYWFARTTPAARFALAPTAGGDRLCFRDEMERYRLAPGEGARYRVRAYDFAGHPIAIDSKVSRGGDPGAWCTAPVKRPGDHHGYTIFAVTKMTRDGELPPVLVHVAGRSPRVVGIERR